MEVSLKAIKLVFVSWMPVVDDRPAADADV